MTGAGISTESGIPDYRSPGGMWEKVDPMEYASIQALRRDPKKFFSFTLESMSLIRKAEPNTGHKVLAQLQNLGLIGPIVTQNIDNLHTKGGAFQIYEVHGHIRSASCMSCRNKVPMDTLLMILEAGINPPVCDYCGGILKPDVVYFGESMSPDYESACRLVSVFRSVPKLMVVVGSSLMVSPINYLPTEFDKLVIINNAPTDFDYRAVLVFREQIGNVMEQLWNTVVNMNNLLEPDPLPPGFMIGSLIGYLETKVNDITREKNKTDALENRASHIISDIMAARMVLNKYPPRQQILEEEILNFLKDELDQYDTRIKDWADENGIKLSMVNSKISNLFQNLFNEHVLAFKVIAREKSRDNSRVLELMAARVIGIFGLWSFVADLIKEEQPDKSMLNEFVSSIQPYGFSINIEEAMHNY